MRCGTAKQDASQNTARPRGLSTSTSQRNELDYIFPPPTLGCGSSDAPPPPGPAPFAFVAPRLLGGGGSVRGGQGSAAWDGALSMMSDIVPVGSAWTGGGSGGHPGAVVGSLASEALPSSGQRATSSVDALCGSSRSALGRPLMPVDDEVSSAVSSSTFEGGRDSRAAPNLPLYGGHASVAQRLLPDPVHKHHAPGLRPVLALSVHLEELYETFAQRLPTVSRAGPSRRCVSGIPSRRASLNPDEVGADSSSAPQSTSTIEPVSTLAAVQRPRLQALNLGTNAGAGGSSGDVDDGVSPSSSVAPPRRQHTASLTIESPGAPGYDDAAAEPQGSAAGLALPTRAPQTAQAQAPGLDISTSSWANVRPPTPPGMADSASQSASYGFHVPPAGMRTPQMALSASHVDPQAVVDPLTIDSPQKPHRVHIQPPNLAGSLSGSGGSQQHGGVSGAGPRETPSFTTRFPRALTEPAELVRKRHSDGQTYEVDNANGDLVLFVGMVLLERYEVISMLGAGTFGQVALCRDLRFVQAVGTSVSPMSASRHGIASLSRRSSMRGFGTPGARSAPAPASPGSAFGHAPQQPELVAVKVIKSDAAYERQSALEVNIAGEVLDRASIDDPRRNLIVRNFGHGYSYGHYCIVFELLGASVFDMLQANDFKGVSISAVRDVARELLGAVGLCADADVTHSDIKPENVLFVRRDDAARRGSGGGLSRSVGGTTPVASGGGGHRGFYDHQHGLSVSQLGGSPVAPQGPSVRLIDFGAAFRTGQCPFTYIQSRYYRAPEVILDTPGLGAEIDVWSVGCLLAEMFLGLPLFPGGDDYQQLALITEMLGRLPDRLLQRGRAAAAYFDERCPAYASKPPTPRPGNAETADGAAADCASGAELRPENDFYAAFAQLSRPEPLRRYFNYTKLSALVDNYPLSEAEREWIERVNAAVEAAGGQPAQGMRPQVIAHVLADRRRLADFLACLLSLDPTGRPDTHGALSHPFLAANAGLPPPDAVAIEIVTAE